MSTPITETPYGPVSTKVLEELRSDFDTTQLLRAVSRLDELRTTLLAPEGIRDDLLRVHAMAITVINGAGMSVRGGVETLPGLAQDIVVDLAELKEAIQDILDSVYSLVALATDT